MNKKVVLVTSGQPSLNPRLVKEADALANAGYSVTVLYAYWNEWGTEFDRQLLPLKKWDAIRIGGDPRDRKLTFLLSKIMHKLARKINSVSGGRFLPELAIARPAWFLKRATLKQKADIYIGHNLGALAAVVNAAKHHQKHCMFDAEDYHRHEISDDPKNADVILKKSLEEKYYPQLTAFTTSSIAIADAYGQLFPGLKPLVIHNVFAKSTVVVKPLGANNPVKLLWFSQAIDVKRGIEDIIGALQQLNGDHFELHLLGKLSTHSVDFVNYLQESNVDIVFHEPVAPDALIEFASQFDIGLALEPGFSINNNLALSNKIFTYLQAGLAVIASNTTAQKAFMETNASIGKLYHIGDVQQLADSLDSFYKDRESLLASKKAALQAGHAIYNWEQERGKFLKLVNDTLLHSDFMLP